MQINMHGLDRKVQVPHSMVVAVRSHHPLLYGN